MTMQPYYQDSYATLYLADNRAAYPVLPSGVIISDVPYGDKNDMDYKRFTSSSNGSMQDPLSRHSWPAITGDDEPFDPEPWIGKEAVKRWRRAVLWGANRYLDKLGPGTILVWDKRIPGQDKNHFLSDGEVAWGNFGNGVHIFSHHWSGFNRASERGEHYHAAQKPVALATWCIERVGVKPGEYIVDPYCGSGWVLVAAKRMGLKSVGCEIEERWAETAARRLQDTAASVKDADKAEAGDQLTFDLGV